MSAPGWYPDPQGEHQFRYWDGAAWTDHVHDEPAGAVADPVATVATASAAVAPRPAGSPPLPARPAPDVRGGTHSGLAWIVALVILVVVFVVSFLIASAVTGDDGGDGNSRTVSPRGSVEVTAAV